MRIVAPIRTTKRQTTISSTTHALTYTHAPTPINNFIARAYAEDSSDEPSRRSSPVARVVWASLTTIPSINYTGNTTTSTTMATGAHAPVVFSFNFLAAKVYRSTAPTTRVPSSMQLAATAVQFDSCTLPFALECKYLCANTHLAPTQTLRAHTCTAGRQKARTCARAGWKGNARVRVTFGMVAVRRS